MSRGEFLVEGGIPCRGGNSMSRGEFHVEGGIPCRGGNSRVDGVISCRRNSMDTELYILLKKTLKSVFTRISVFFRFFFKNALAD